MSLNPKKVELDVRPILRNNEEPFQVIMEAVSDLTNTDDTLMLHATFKPEPLLKVMQEKGFSNHVEQLEDEHWVVTFTHE